VEGGLSEMRKHSECARRETVAEVVEGDEYVIEDWQEELS
jgi:hypothetical protein